MKKIEHQVFLEKSGLSPKDLPEPIHEKIKIFNKMLSMKEETSGEDLKKLDKELKELDRELMGDLEQEYEDSLAHNDLMETENKADQDPPVKTIQKTDTKPTGDEAILENLFKDGRVNDILRSDLRDLGFTGTLSGSRRVGKFYLHRSSMFSFQYHLKRMENSTV